MKARKGNLSREVKLRAGTDKPGAALDTRTTCSTSGRDASERLDWNVTLAGSSRGRDVGYVLNVG